MTLADIVLEIKRFISLLNFVVETEIFLNAVKPLSFLILYISNSSLQDHQTIIEFEKS